MRTIYFDYNATTPLDAQVREAMLPFMDGIFGNPSSVHHVGRKARSLLDDARERAAKVLGSKPSELVFTSGGTESNNLAVFGAARLNKSKGRHLITSAIEHDAVLNCFEYLAKKEGFELTVLPVSREGVVSPVDLKNALRPDTILVSIMAANNEIGTLQPVAELGAICRERGVLFHTDAVQWFGKETFESVLQFNADFVSICAHKFHGPKGAGALFIRSPLQPEPLIFGGGHENERRAGTENVAGIIGMVEALERFVLKPVFDRDKLVSLSNRLIKLVDGIEGIQFVGSRERRLANTVSFVVAGSDSIALLAGLDLEGICASSGSACSAGSLTPSHVITALGVEPKLANSLVRFSLGRDSTAEEVALAEAAVPEVIKKGTTPPMIARVTLELALRKEFDYSIPPELLGQVDVGSRVQVPFGARKVLGCVTAVAEESALARLRPILKVIGAQTLVTPKVLKLARWIGEYYCCAPEIALKSVLPEAVRKEQAGWRQRLFVRALVVSGELPKLAKRQREVWNIIEERREMPLQELLEVAETTAATVRHLEDKGLVSVTTEISERDPHAHEHFLPTQPLLMNPQQVKALDKIIEAMDRADSKAASVDVKPEADANASAPAGSRVFLLHGVTGSGKTEVYLQALAHALERGKGGIVLVPEISLTPQTVERFKARFSSGPLRTLVAVLHSHLSAGERHDEWHKIRQGRARIVIGARSAIFAPVEPLGLIIVDEEHEHTYKQEEAPRYHARDVAIVRGQMEGATVVLGSATPSLESFYNCLRGKYTLLEMPERVDNIKMPAVRVVDMRQAGRGGKGPPIFSPQLKEAITRRLERGEQTILFLNRRGFSTSLQCPLCGYVAKCPNCSVSLTYHRKAQNLCCHVCGHVEPVPAVCPEPKCRNPAIRYSGLGTERVEDTLVKLFPDARIKRMDSDALKRKDDFRKILSDFRTGKIDVLVGTQMIAKGLHFPNVTLVGIVHADLALHLPDFRAAERTFQLLTQVAGRAGRGDIEGEVFVQSFTPFHPAIQFARRHDFNGFYEQEIEFREQLKYPPVSRAAMLTLKGRNEDKVRLSADHLRKQLEKELADVKGLVIAGPAPAPLARAESLYRFQIMLRVRQMSPVSRKLAVLAETITLADEVSLAIDIDPVDMA